MVNFGNNLSHYTLGDIDIAVGSRFQPIPDNMIADVIDTEKMIMSAGDKLFIETPDSSSSVVATVSTIGL